MEPTLQINPLVYKQNNNTYLPSGQYLKISCNFTYQGVCYINMAGEEVSLPSTSIPPLAATPGNSYQSAEVLVDPGRVWQNPFQFGDATYYKCVKVKDNDSNVLSIVDFSSWNTSVALCNNVPEPISCGLPSTLTATPGATTATINFTVLPGSVGYEWVNNTSSSAPTGAGTYGDAGTASVALTGLTASTTYYFWFKTVCGAGSTSSWTSVSYTTT